MSKTREIKQIIKDLEFHKTKLSVERDAIAELFDELENFKETVSDAYDSFQYAIDRLSEIV